MENNDFIPLEFKDSEEFNSTLLRLLINNNAYLKLLINLEVEKRAKDMIPEEYEGDDYVFELERIKKELNISINDMIREYKLETLAEINLHK